jgi:ribonuclease HII
MLLRAYRVHQLSIISTLIPSMDRSTRTLKRKASTDAAAEQPMEQMSSSNAKQSKKKISLGPSQEMEEALRGSKRGITHVVGVDEAGRGPLAGPVVVAAVILPIGLPSYAPLINDSKKMTDVQRDEAFQWLIQQPSILWSAVAISHSLIDKLNILNATTLGMSETIRALLQPRGSDKNKQHQGGDEPSAWGLLYTTLEGKKNEIHSETIELLNCDGYEEKEVAIVRSICKREEAVGASSAYALIDGNRVPKDLTEICQGGEAVVKGDAKVLSIAAASVIAKVLRDKIMIRYASSYPQWGFEGHMAYGVPSHLAAIKEHGPSPIHRRSFNPVKTMLGWEREDKEVQRSVASSIPETAVKKKRNSKIKPSEAEPV